ncbi:MAG: HD domain-containing protein [Omnitrophica bacterium]|nr:HD domain-containing protein [Candidatus Omnitrophota bacterium]
MHRQNIREINGFLKGYKHVSEMAGEAIFIHSTHGNIFDVNTIAEKLTGYKRNELLTMNVRQMHTRPGQKVASRALDMIDRTEIKVDFDSHIKRKDGKIIDVRIIGNKFKFKEDFFVIGLVKDTTPYEKNLKRKPESGVVRNVRARSFLNPLGKVYVEPIQVLVELAESRDFYTMEHSAKVANHVMHLANSIKLPKKEVETLKLAAMLHDIGKIGIRTEILMKAGGLTSAEYEEIKRHPLLSVEIIKSIKTVKGLIPTVRHHHENYDGTGYPDGLKDGKIPIGARILALCDVYDALISERAYRRAFSHSDTIKIMKDKKEKKFDPMLLKKFLLYATSQN